MQRKGEVFEKPKIVFLAILFCLKLTVLSLAADRPFAYSRQVVRLQLTTAGTLVLYAKTKHAAPETLCLNTVATPFFQNKCGICASAE